LYGATRAHLPNLKKSALILASFEKTCEIMYNAAAIGKADRMLGVSERIITG